MDIKVAKNLNRIREERSITQEALAEALKVNPLVVYRWEAGRLPVEYKMIKRIAEFFDISVEELLGTDDEEDDSESIESDELPLNCRICGGDLVHNYLSGTCVCANCGTKKAISVLFPGFNKYSNIVVSINKANEILDNKTKPASADEANLLYKQARNECLKICDTVSSELIKLCDEGQERVEKFDSYCRGKYFFENRLYKKAVVELDKARGYRDADEMLKRCRATPGKRKKS